METLRWKPSKVSWLLRKLEEEGFIEFPKGSSPRRGRPKKVPVVTSLGRIFVEAFRACDKWRVRSTMEDVRSSIRRARQTERLVALGRRPYEMFWELNEIARNVRDSAEADRPT